MAAAGGTPATVAVLGAGGTMGLPIARNLARSGLTVRAWNRTAARAAALADDGAKLASSPAEAAHGADVVITMLADTEAVLAAMGEPGGGLAAMAPGTTWAQLSTIGEQGTSRCAALADTAGIAFADAPVLGSRQPAEERKLVVLASGPAAARENLAPVFAAIAGRTLWVGEAGAGSRLKLVVNSWVLSVVEAGAEALALAEGLGLDGGLLLEALEGGALDLPYLRMKGSAMLRGDFTPAFRLTLAAKDAALVSDAARQRGLDLPVLEAIAERLAQGARSHGDLDFSATYLTSSPRQE